MTKFDKLFKTIMNDEDIEVDSSKEINELITKLSDAVDNAVDGKNKYSYRNYNRATSLMQYLKLLLKPFSIRGNDRLTDRVRNDVNEISKDLLTPFTPEELKKYNDDKYKSSLAYKENNIK